MERVYRWGRRKFVIMQMLNCSNITLENLKFLSSRQALHDLAEFITFVKDEYKLGKSAKVIVWGGSYSGKVCLFALSNNVK